MIRRPWNGQAYCCVISAPRAYPVPRLKRRMRDLGRSWLGHGSQPPHQSPAARHKSMRLSGHVSFLVAVIFWRKCVSATPSRVGPTSMLPPAAHTHLPSRDPGWLSSRIPSIRSQPASILVGQQHTLEGMVHPCPAQAVVVPSHSPVPTATAAEATHLGHHALGLLPKDSQPSATHPTPTVTSPPCTAAVLTSHLLGVKVQ